MFVDHQFHIEIFAVLIFTLQGVQAHLSIGGWSGSIYYSSAVGSAPNRTAFVKAVVGLAQKYSLDGIDFEYVILRFLLHSPAEHQP